MRKLSSLNRIEISTGYENKTNNIMEVIEISSYDIANIHPSEEVYMIYIDCEGELVVDKERFNFSISIDLLTDEETDKNIDNELEDIGEIEQLIQVEFLKNNSTLKNMIRKQIELFKENLHTQIDL